MLTSERMMYILQQIKLTDSVRVKDICEHLGASESTIRRDLEELEKQNKLKRVHGGAIKVSLSSILNDSEELTMKEKLSVHMDAKKSLCIEASKLVNDGDCIFIDGGTTFIQLLPYLAGKRIKVVTHSDLIRIDDKDIELNVIGGKYLSSLQMNVGPIAIEQLNKFNFDKAFIGCAGVDLASKHAFTTEVESAQIKEIAINKSVDTYLVIDSSKLNLKGFYSFAVTEDFTKIITNKTNEEEIDNENIIYV